MKPQIMAKLFGRMAHVVKASVDTGQDGEKFAAYRVRLFGVGMTRDPRGLQQFWPCRIIYGTLRG
jgi:hypothetical protein